MILFAAIFGQPAASVAQVSTHWHLTVSRKPDHVGVGAVAFNSVLPARPSRLDEKASPVRPAAAAASVRFDFPPEGSLIFPS